MLLFRQHGFCFGQRRFASIALPPIGTFEALAYFYIIKTERSGVMDLNSTQPK